MSSLCYETKLVLRLRVKVRKVEEKVPPPGCMGGILPLDKPKAAL